MALPKHIMNTVDSMPLQVFPSIMAADLTDMRSSLRKAKKADGIHFDVMDAHFVPNLTFGPDTLNALKSITKLPIMVHLMVEFPDHVLKKLLPHLGPKDLVFVHLENDPLSRDKALAMARRAGVGVGIAVNPETDAHKAATFIAKHAFKNILLLGIHPGFTGLHMLPGTVQKTRKLQLFAGANARIFVDGGVTVRNALLLKDAGAYAVCSGKEIFSSRNPAKAIRAFHKL